MIGRFKSPRCFKNFNIGKYVTYIHSNKALMNREIFNKWLSDFDCELAKKKRKILLAIDQCPSHQIIVTLNSIEILFLPPRTSSLLQPMDQGIIKCFKAEFTNLKINDIIEKVEAGENCQNAINAITLKTAATLTFFAWNKVTPTTIKNCFRHAQWIKCETITINSESKNYENNYEEIIKKFQIDDPISYSEFVDYGYTENEFNQLVILFNNYI
ncbi:tigger transposable element-derived protein 6-like [Octopus sinensis]|uniref:Tigger transposable element-derived protein 6-like n=1 Tax=Octopus sinensis TaxID=2607531 RepID=A0A6P7U122_9MOLL|nr:tigger transposable element-derived protein 6-like [Octopus sinensis]